MSWTQFITSILPLIGVIIGGVLTYLTQAKISNNQLKREGEKEKENKKVERVLVYNEVLKIDGEIQMLDISSHFPQFNLSAYRGKIRPIVYSKFHLLNEGIANNVRRMDDLIAIYSKIIEEIEKEIKYYRQTIKF